MVLELLLSFCVLFLGLSEAADHSKDLTKCRQVCYQKVGFFLAVIIILHVL